MASTSNAARMTGGPRPTVGSDSEEEDQYLGWVRNFMESPGSEFFCAIDTDFILDRFNLTGLGRCVSFAEEGYERLTRDSSESDSDILDSSDEELEAQADTSAKLLYGLLHARYIITPYGLSLMKRKYLRGDFGRCPRYLCEGQHVLPIGLSDTPRGGTVKLFCPRCRDTYQPRTNIHAAIEGAFFGTSFPHIFMMHYKMDCRPVPDDLHRHPTCSHSLNPLHTSKRLEDGQEGAFFKEDLVAEETASGDVSEDDCA